MSIYENKKLSYISKKCGSGKGVYLQKEIETQVEHFDNYHLVVMPTKILIEQFKNYFLEFCDSVTVIVSDDDVNYNENVQLLPRINQVLQTKTYNIVMITEKMFYRIEPSRLCDWNVWIDDCNKFCDLKIRGIREDDKEEILSIYNKLFLTSNSYAEISSCANDPVNFKYKKVEMNLNINLSEDMKGLINVYQTMKFYHEVVILEDSLLGKVNQLVLAGWYDLTRYVDESINITYLSNDFESSLLYKRWSHLFQEVSITVENETKIKDNDLRIDVKYFFDCTKTDRGLSKIMLENQLDGNVKLVQDYLESILQHNNYYWTTNNNSKFVLSGKNKITPNQRGMNHLKDIDVCVFMAAMNAHPNSSEYLSDLFDFTIEDMIREFEIETMYQFIYRSVVRDYVSSKRVTVYVYDSEQANAFSSGSVEKIDLGLSSSKRKSGPKVKVEAAPELKSKFKKWKYKNNHRADTFIKFDLWVVKVLRSNPEFEDEDFQGLRKTLSVE
ncbi:TPA: hypothetical protein U5E00_003827 [Yersinia enterocolitica]|nr:hypothetical protein [Yersinia enterocolitica]HEN3584746.1 hypothetical protein [Yersinia enterocolitica]